MTIQQIRERLDNLEKDEPELFHAIQELLKVNKEVNKLPIGNFYLPETFEGLLSSADPR